MNAIQGNANAFGTPAPANSIEFDPNTSANSVEKMYTFNTVDDDVDETENRIIVIIRSSSGTYHYSVPDDGTQTATTNLVDKGPTIALEFVNEKVTKGQPAQFRLTASSKIVSEAIVMVEVTDPNNCIANGAPTQTMIPIGQTEGLLEVMTFSDQTAPECMISASLNEDARYKVSEAKNSATIMVVNELIYTVSITTGDSIVEGQDAVFTITTSPIPETSFELDLKY